MSYVANRPVNLLNLHYGIAALALHGGGVFVPMFLLRSGVPVPAVLGALALGVLLRFALRPLVLIVGRRVGIKPMLLLGTVVCGLYYLLLPHVHGVDLMLLAVCVVGAVGEIFYWTCYHAYFAALGDTDRRGHQLGAREALAALTGVAAPLATGWILMTFGPRVAFGSTTVIQLAAALPLMFTPNVSVSDDVQGAFRAAFHGISIFVLDGWISASYLVAWQLALFVSLGENYAQFGAAMALAAVAGAIAGLLLGRHIDAGHGHRATWLTLVGLAVAIVFRAVSTGNPGVAVMANACGALVTCLYQTTVMTVIYNQAKSSPCVLRFHVATEGGWDVGFAAGCLSGAALTLMGTPLSLVVLLAIAGVAPLLVLVLRHYAQPTSYVVSGFSRTGSA